MIDIRKLKELVRLMVENELSELDLKDQQETVSIKRGGAGTVINHQPVIYGSGVAAGPAPSAPARRPMPSEDSGEDAGGNGAGSASSAAPVSEAGLVAIESPMVGTFYTAANPDSPAFVQVGATVGPDTTVCLIEAMKVFNEIKAETSGTIERILVENGKPIEFGQKLFLVRPA
jgi:acetyl-CoA carboxylase biotin carboxyl carrier protein